MFKDKVYNKITAKIIISAIIYTFLLEVNTSFSKEKQETNCNLLVGEGKIETIQEALDIASSNERDDIICIKSGTYLLEKTLQYRISSNSKDCGKKLTIKAYDGKVILDGRDSIRIMSIDTHECYNDISGDIAIEGITFKRGLIKDILGNDGGALLIKVNKANIIIKENIFENNNAYSRGGGIYLSSTGFASIINNIFSRNNAFGSLSSGGGVYVEATSIEVKNNIFDGNSANDYGGSAELRASKSIIFSENKISNSSARYGAGINAYSNGIVNFIRNTFINNKADLFGGGLSLLSSPKNIVIDNNRFENNYAGSKGGGVSINSFYSKIELFNNKFMYNHSEEEGGGAYISSDDSCILINNVFYNNSSNSNGGGIYIRSNQMVSLINNNIVSNKSVNYGGGVFLESTISKKIDIYNNIIWNNSSYQEGKSIYVRNENDLVVNIAHNIFSITNPKINFSKIPQNEEIFFKFLTLNYNKNLPTGCKNSEDFGNIQIDPQFLDTELRLQATSFAIDNGCSKVPGVPKFDIDGKPRILGKNIDIGVYEYK